MKICCYCNICKPLSEFWNYSRKPDGLQSRCKICKRIYDNLHYKSRTKEQKENKLFVSQTRRKQIVREIKAYALEKWCHDCWYRWHIAALQFDHMRDKVAQISTMLVNGFSREVIFREIEKCEVRCANCHAIKTSEQFKWYQ